MKFRVNMECDNAAFDVFDAEVARILRDLADKVEAGNFAGQVRDLNGNTVGEFVTTGKRRAARG